MRLRWVLLITIIAGLLFGPLITDLPGFVVIAIGNYTMQTRLWQLVVVTIILLVLFILLYHLVARFWNTAGRVKRWSGGRRWKKARQKTIKGMIALSEGDWQKAEKTLIAAVPDSDTQLINLLAAAQAAQAQKADARRDDYLRQAHLAEPDAEIAIGLTQAQQQLNHGQYEQALATLTHLQNIAPKHGHVLLLLQKLYRYLGDWKGFLDLVPELKKFSNMEHAKLEQFQFTAWHKLLIREAARGGIEPMQSFWMSIPKAARNNMDMIYSYVELLIQHEGFLEAEKILRTHIKKQQDVKLLNLYGKFVADDPGRQLSFIEGIGKKFVGNADWLLTAGRLCLNKKLWGKARTYLEQSLALKPAPETYQELARAYEALGEMELAKQCYSKGLDESINKPVLTKELQTL
ncbi:MAG: heme biosynthesis protein HemY [Gammaproteobacteria bacterium]|nr:heme biosynthesis protein HemY [Gammaproteobacteria bacterium]